MSHNVYSMPRDRFFLFILVEKMLAIEKKKERKTRKSKTASAARLLFRDFPGSENEVDGWADDLLKEPRPLLAVGVKLGEARRLYYTEDTGQAKVLTTVGDQVRLQVESDVEIDPMRYLVVADNVLYRIDEPVPGTCAAATCVGYISNAEATLLRRIQNHTSAVIAGRSRERNGALVSVWASEGTHQTAPLPLL